MTKTTTYLFFILTIAAFGCGDDDSLSDTSVDSGGDTSTDSGSDSGADTASDADTDPDDAEPGDTGVEDTTPPPESCDEEGDTRIAACERCGQKSEICTGGVWEDNSACLDPGECEAGEVETRRTDLCGEETRLCNAECGWLDWSRTAEDRECLPGTELPREPDAMCPEGASRTVQRCNDECMYETIEGPCDDGCGPVTEDTLRSGHAELVCVPAGPVMMRALPGGESFIEVELTSYRIGRYPVSQRRYGECVTDGGCLESDYFPSIGLDDNPHNRTRFAAAERFCEWDGGRVPTLAEWVKAARGPAPRQNDVPWWNGLEGDESNDYWSCETVPSPLESTGCRDLLREPVDSLPETSSYYGVENQMSWLMTSSWVSDFFTERLADEYMLVDPTGPSDGRHQAMFFSRVPTSDRTIDSRGPVRTDDSRASFRCVYRE